MSIAAIVPALPVQRLVDSFLDEAWRGRRALVHAFGWPERMVGANAPPAGLAYALTRVRRLLRLVRLTFFIVATWLQVTPPRDRRLPAGQVVGRSNKKAGWKPALLDRAPSLFPHQDWRLQRDGPPTAQPAQLAHAHRDSLRLLTRHLDTLTRALLDPMPHVRRIARRLMRGHVYFVKPASKRLPHSDKRDHLESVDAAASHADYEKQRWLRQRPREDSS